MEPGRADCFDCLLKAVSLPAPQYTPLNQRFSTLYALHAITKDVLALQASS